MDTRMEALVGMVTVLGILVLLVLPSLYGIAYDRRVDRQLREAAERRTPEPAAARPGAGAVTPRQPAGPQKSSSNPTEPSTATWYAEGRRSKKLVSS
ncbi:hypothetical protein ACFV6E_15290 [Streptomyces sp. NPDC059785]|uniref:hypothetical protein n=1 Tax=unclassified Streptomyces TaxID=2593676 RepID=UPI003649253E